MASRMTLSTAVVISSCDAYGAHTLRIALPCLSERVVHEEERTHALLCRVMFSAFSMAACTLGGRSSRLPSTFKRTPCLSSISLLPRKHQGKSLNENRKNIPALCYLDEPLLSKLHDRVHLILGSVKVLDCKRVHGHTVDT